MHFFASPHAHMSGGHNALLFGADGGGAAARRAAMRGGARGGTTHTAPTARLPLANARARTRHLMWQAGGGACAA
jgi:hypothetical protein